MPGLSFTVIESGNCAEQWVCGGDVFARRRGRETLEFELFPG